MKTLFRFILVMLVSASSFAQEKNIETESVSIDNLINFVVEQYSTSKDSIPDRNITFLIDTYADDYDIEDRVVLKQAFKLISKRLKERDSVFIVSYSNYNGIVLNRTSAKDDKKLIYAIENPKSSIKFIEENGIELAYQLAKENFTEDSENSVVMIRIPKRKTEVASKTSKNSKKEVKEETKISRNNNAVVLTAIALLPELISVIKD